MTCKQCGSATELVDQSGGTNGGSFREEYECVNCDAKGWIRGESSDPPQQWNRSGSVFERPRRDVAAEKENIE